MYCEQLKRECDNPKFHLCETCLTPSWCWCRIKKIIGPEHNPEQSPDNSGKTLPVSECANPEERSKPCGLELKA